MTGFLQYAFQRLLRVNRKLTQRRKNFILASNFLILFILLGIILTLNHTKWVPLVSTEDGTLIHSITQGLDLAAIDYRIRGDSICVEKKQYARAVLQLTNHRVAGSQVLSATAQVPYTKETGKTQSYAPGFSGTNHERHPISNSIDQGR